MNYRNLKIVLYSSPDEDSEILGYAYYQDIEQIIWNRELGDWYSLTTVDGVSAFCKKSAIMEQGGNTDGCTE